MTDFKLKVKVPRILLEHLYALLCCYSAKSRYGALFKMCRTTVINQTSKQNYDNELWSRITLIDSKTSSQLAVKFLDVSQ